MEKIRQELGVTGSSIYYDNFTYYTNDKGDYWTIEFPKDAQFSYYSTKNIEITQPLEQFHSLSELSLMLKNLLPKINKEHVKKAKEAKLAEIKELKRTLKELQK